MNAFTSQRIKLQVHSVDVVLQSGYIERCMNPSLKLLPVSPGICQVLTDAGRHVGNLKLIGGVWKFKAIGHDNTGQIIPGGGPLTGKHNIVFAVLNEAEINRVFQLKL